MNPSQHAFISAFMGLVFGLLLAPQNLPGFILMAVFSGTVVDVDHFLIGRIVHRDWRFLKKTFSSFWSSVIDVQSVVTEREEFPGNYRLLSHSMILLALITASFVFESWMLESSSLAVLVHIVSDIHADTFQW